MEYTYFAIDQTGSKVSGTIHAPSPQEAMERLASQGFIPTRVQTGGKSSEGDLTDRINLFLARVKTPELILFTKQFRTLFKAGISMRNLWEVIHQQTENPKLRKAAGQIAVDINTGVSLYDAFNKHPGIFSSLYCSMIQAGEKSGRLPEVLDRLVYLLQHEHKVKSDIKSALRYPMIVVAALVGAFFFLLAFVIPQFVGIFQSANIDLPMPTKVAVNLHEWLIVYWPISLSVFVAFLIVMALYLKTNQGQFNKDRLLLRLPILGPVFAKGAMARFASIFAILQSSGVSVINTLSILSGTIGNAAISREFDSLQEKLKEGKGISGPLRSANYFTPMVINMVAIGEESGNLDEMLQEVSAHYDDEVSYVVSRMSETIGPVLMVALAAVVGFFALAIFMPMWDLVQMV